VLCWIPMFGGLLIMMGHHPRSEALFYYFRLEDQIPENHLLQLIDKHVSFEFVRQQLKDSYSETGRPSIDPELLLRILLIGYLYGITSERSWWKSCACTWHGAGSLDWGSIRKFRTTRRFPRTGTGGFKSRSCSSNCLSRSCGSAWKWDWYSARVYPSTAVSIPPTPPRGERRHDSGTTQTIWSTTTVA
jgi:hypothetical protein